MKDNSDEMEVDMETSIVQTQEALTCTRKLNSTPPIEIAFSASAGMFVYQMGVAAFLQDHFDLSNCRFLGCSGGSWVATLLASETSVREAWRVIKEMQAKIITSPKWYSGYCLYATIVE
ncbi:unnamed protein product [Peronospora belbahrii]|uniref:PNPLA domain-containing protein n=1 Tax=Peronospora belbahrii TaxID=622444 RepID=A0ABN8CMJ7_9STRA|nr:unnamed protein product [Peronospora belbahrii]